jgi:hypothetical protein
MFPTFAAHQILTEMMHRTKTEISQKRTNRQAFYCAVRKNSTRHPAWALLGKIVYSQKKVKGDWPDS